LNAGITTNHALIRQLPDCRLNAYVIISPENKSKREKVENMQNDIVRQPPASQQQNIKPALNEQAEPQRYDVEPETKIVDGPEPATAKAEEISTSQYPYIVITIAIAICLALAGMTVYVGIQGGFIAVN